MTLITDGSGTRWVERPRRKQRKPSRALKFGAVQIGDQLVHRAPDGSVYNCPHYYLVTDLWFDPVKGEDDPIKGQMVGFAQIGASGIPGGKSSTTVRGLASQRYDYADIDYIRLCFATSVAMETEVVVGIGAGKVIRARPKTTWGGRL